MKLTRGDLSLLDFWLELNIWYFLRRAQLTRNIYRNIRWRAKAGTAANKRSRAMQQWLTDPEGAE